MAELEDDEHTMSKLKLKVNLQERLGMLSLRNS
jgi:hypothetical protein